jgi:hypothetical protein
VIEVCGGEGRTMAGCVATLTLNAVKGNAFKRTEKYIEAAVNLREDYGKKCIW